MENSRKTLYLVETKGRKSYYVLATSFDEASQTVENALDKAGYDYTSYRKVESITVMAKEIKEFPKNKPHFAEDQYENLLLIADNLQTI